MHVYLFCFSLSTRGLCTSSTDMTRAAVKGTNLREQTPICNLLQVLAVFSTKICTSQMLWFLS